MAIATIINGIWCALVKVVNALTDHVLETITDTLGWLIALLPSIPWMFEPLDWGPFGNLVGYFIPISAMLTHFTYMLGIVVIWYSLQHILRITKAIK